MPTIDPSALLILAALGWGLTLYFGFFRFRQYQWTRRKVELDVFTRLNRRSEQLFLRTTTLSSIKEKNGKIIAKRNGVLVKYLEGIEEKLLLLREGAIAPDLGRHWLRAIQRELEVLYDQDQSFRSELRELYERYGTHTDLPIATLLARDPADRELQLEELFPRRTLWP